MLLEVERLLNELNKNGKHIDYLLMENVPPVISDPYFKEWCGALEKLNYTNYCKVLNAKDYGIPQNRKRAFMISLYNNEKDGYYYEFPKPISLKIRLKHILEEEVDEKFYLSEKMVNYLTKEGTGTYNRKEVFERNLNPNKDVASAILTTAGQRAVDNFICDVQSKNGETFITKGTKQLNETLENNNINDGTILDLYNRTTSDNGIVQTLDTDHNSLRIATRYSDSSIEYIKKNIEEDIAHPILAGSSNQFTGNGCNLVKVNLKRGYSVDVGKEQNETEKVDVIGNYSKSEYVQTSIVGKNGLAPTFTENHGQVTAIVEEQKDTIRIRNATKQGYTDAKVGDGIDISTRIENHRGTVQDGLAQTLKCTQDVGVVVPNVKLIGGIGEKKSNGGTQYYEQDRVYDSSQVATSVTTQEQFHPNYNCGLRIRKLTPYECSKLMGLKQSDFRKMEKNQTQSSLFHMLGDSIVVSVLCAIFGELLGIDWHKAVNEIVEDITTKQIGEKLEIEY